MIGIGARLLHGSGHVGGTAGFHWWDVAAAALVVGSVGGALYWYYGTRLETS